MMTDRSEFRFIIQSDRSNTANVLSKFTAKLPSFSYYDYHACSLIYIIIAHQFKN